MINIVVFKLMTPSRDEVLKMEDGEEWGEWVRWYVKWRKSPPACSSLIDGLRYFGGIKSPHLQDSTQKATM
jgi:hypothetical protein